MKYPYVLLPNQQYVPGPQLGGAPSLSRIVGLLPDHPHEYGP